jgi:hypothetical protein
MKICNHITDILPARSIDRRSDKAAINIGLAAAVGIIRTISAPHRLKVAREGVSDPRLTGPRLQRTTTLTNGRFSEVDDRLA